MAMIMETVSSFMTVTVGAENMKLARLVED
jgi:hypothetical protein